MKFSELLSVELASRGFTKQASLAKRANPFSKIIQAGKDAYNQHVDLLNTEHRSGLNEEHDKEFGQPSASDYEVQNTLRDNPMGKKMSGKNYRVVRDRNSKGIGTGAAVEFDGVKQTDAVKPTGYDYMDAAGAGVDAMGAMARETGKQIGEGYDAYADAVHNLINPDVGPEGKVSDLPDNLINARAEAIRIGKILNDPEQMAGLRPDQVRDLERRRDAAMRQLGGGQRLGPGGAPKSKGSAIDDPERARAAQEKIRARQRQYQQDVQDSEAAVGTASGAIDKQKLKAYQMLRDRAAALRQQAQAARAAGRMGEVRRLNEQRMALMPELNRQKADAGVEFE